MQMNTTDHLWRYVHNEVMDEIRTQRWYNGMPPYGLRGFLNDKSNRIIGYPILRQIRSARFVCEVTPPMNLFIRECNGEQNILYEDDVNYCAGWVSQNASLSSLCDYPEFKYESGTDLQTFEFQGRVSTYGAGGYVTRLAGTRASITARLKELQKHHWIDQRTKAVFLEFSTYNANVNLFATSRISMEIVKGGVSLSWRFEPVKLLKVGTNLNDQITIFCEFAFVVATVIFTATELWEMKQLKCSYFSQYWNIAELIILILSYIEFFLYIYRSILTTSAVSDFYRTKGLEYVRIDDAVLVAQYFHYIMSFIMFVSLLKLVKLLQFNKHIRVLAQTIRLCWEELSYFFILFTVMFMSFCWLFYFMYSKSLSNFSKFGTTILTTFKMMLGKFNLAEMTEINPILPVLFFFFSVTNSIILINIMLSIILQAFAMVREDLEENKYNIILYMWGTFKKTLLLQPNSVFQVKPDWTLKKQNKIFDDDDDDTEEKLPDKVD